jgi:hypothetical protein
MYYRFKSGMFVKADTFEEAKATLLKQIQEESEEAPRWHRCTCLGFQHRHDCPENKHSVF